MNPAVLASQTSIYVTFIASFMIWVLFGGLIILWIVDGRIKKEIVLHAIVSVILAWAVAEIIKTLFPTVRPYKLNGAIPMTFTLLHGAASFPSTHSAVAFALSASVWFHNKKIGLMFLIGAFIVALGRVLGNVHYPIDVIGGAFVGAGVSYIISKVHVHTLLKKMRSNA